MREGGGGGVAGICTSTFDSFFLIVYICFI